MRCPLSGLPFSIVDRLDAERSITGAEVPLSTRLNRSPRPVGATRLLLLRSDGRAAFPVDHGIPVLLAPEVLTSRAEAKNFDLRDPKYAEAYEEMEFYNRVATAETNSSDLLSDFPHLRTLLSTRSQDDRFMQDRWKWIDAVYDAPAQDDAYRHLGPLTDKTVAQIGGKGIHAVKFLLAGARLAWVITPMLGEAKCALALARRMGVEEKLRCVVGLAEELPLADGSVDAIYAGGCVHHMVTDLALPQIARVLRKGGRFSAVEP